MLSDWDGCERMQFDDVSNIRIQAAIFTDIGCFHCESPVPLFIAPETVAAPLGKSPLS